MNPMFDHTFLERYLSGQMTPVEKGTFEMRLEKEPLLRAELAAMKRARGIDDGVGEQTIAEVAETNEPPSANKLPFVLILIFILLVVMYFLARG